MKGKEIKMAVKYCAKCGGEILIPEDKAQLERAICEALLQDSGVHICPKPFYCQCAGNPCLMGKDGGSHLESSEAGS